MYHSHISTSNKKSNNHVNINNNDSSSSSSSSSSSKELHLCIKLVEAPHLGAKLDVRQEEVNAVKDLSTALPDAMEAQPPHCDYGRVTTGGRAKVLLVANLQRVQVL